MDEILKWFSVAAALISVVGFPALLQHLGKTFAKRGDLESLSGTFTKFSEEHEREHDRLDETVTKLRADVAHLPTRDDISKLMDRVASVDKSVGVVGAQVEAMAKAVSGLSDQFKVMVEHEFAESRDAKRRAGD